jgi:hypothetical protein
MPWIKKVYFYLVSLISLVILIVAGIMLINMALKAWVFTKADNNIYYPQISCTSPSPAGTTLPPECNDPDYEAKQKQRDMEQRAAQRQREAANAIAMIIIATPVFLYHWKLARKEA